MGSRRLQVAALCVLTLALGLGAAAGGFFVTDTLRPTPTPTPPAPTPPAYRAVAAAPRLASSPAAAPVPAPAAVARTLAPALSAAGIGGRVRAEILDAASGTLLYARGATVPAAPASTAKLLTAAAVLAVRPAGYRITTTVRAGTGGTVVLVGAGDPTLTGARAGHAGAYAQAARISDLAAQLRRRHVTVGRIVVDDSLFTGPTVSPRWAAEDVPSDYAAPITALLADGGRNAPGDYVRSTAPDLAAGRELARALGRPHAPVSHGRAAAGAAVLASVRSAPLSTLVEQMLHASDNVIAECLARQVALAEHRPAGFTGAAGAVRAVLTRLGDDPGAGLSDGSGLAASDRVSVAVLTRVLRIAAVGPAGVRRLLAALPVAGWSGTLADRYLTGASRAGAGVVRAKTGTLTGVSALAGTVHDRSGRLLLFAVIADRTGSTTAAEAALDGLITRLAGCGCR